MPVSTGVVPIGPVILSSTNGGTVWDVVTLPVPSDSTLGALMAIASTASGKYVWAVGTPVVPTAGLLATTVAPQTLSTAAAPTILMSADYGRSGSWAVQAAPTQAGVAISLTGVVALRGTVAFACGGSMSTRDAAGNGLVFGTANGGFRWQLQTLPAFNYTDTQTTTSIIGTAAAGTLPALSGIAAQTGAGQTTTIWAVGDYGYVVKAAVPAAVRSAQLTWTTPSVLSASNSAMVPTPVAFYGVTWGNARVGYIYGNGVILQTRDGGATWTAAQIPLTQPTWL